MNKRTSKWIGAWMLVIGGCDPFPSEDDTGFEETTDSGGSTTIGSEEGGSVSVTSWGEEGGESSTSTGTTGYGSTESCSVSATTSSGSEGSEDDGDPSQGSETTAGGGPLEACGVELDFADLNNTFMCGCEACNVQYDGLTPASADEFLAACECICDALGCGGSVSGGVTSDGGEDSEGTASGGESGDTEFTGGSEVTGSYEDG